MTDEEREERLQREEKLRRRLESDAARNERERNASTPTLIHDHYREFVQACLLRDPVVVRAEARILQREFGLVATMDPLWPKSGSVSARQAVFVDQGTGAYVPDPRDEARKRERRQARMEAV